MTHHRVPFRAATPVALALGGLLALSFLIGCTQAKVDGALNSPAGQLFCAFETSGRAQIVGGLIATGAQAAAGPVAGPIAGQAVIYATNAGAAYVKAACAQAAANIGALAGVPVSPPVNVAAVPLVAVDPAKLPAPAAPPPA
jgi:hypothetical protein